MWDLGRRVKRRVTAPVHVADRRLGDKLVDQPAVARDRGNDQRMTQPRQTTVTRPRRHPDTRKRQLDIEFLRVLLTGEMDSRSQCGVAVAQRGDYLIRAQKRFGTRRLEL